MIKVVVVDDEPYLLRSIKQSIETTNNNFIVVGEAYDGEEAINIILKTCPDIVFTDIRMPILDGLELIEELRKRKIKVLHVILSGYQEFDYAKRALKLGVVDYLLKPINPDALAKLLFELYNEVMTMKRNQQLNTLELIINDNLFSKEITSNIKKPFCDYLSFCCIFICAGSYCTYTCRQFTPSRELWFLLNLDDIIAKNINIHENYWVIDGSFSNENIIILASNYQETSRFNELSILIHNELSTSKYSVTTIQGNIISNIEDLPLQIQKLKTLMRTRNIFGKSTFTEIIDFHEEYNATDTEITVSIFDTLNILIKNENVSQIRSEINKILEICKKKCYSQYSLEIILREVYNMLLSPERSDKNIIKEKIDEILCNATSYDDIYDGLCFYVEDVFKIRMTQNVNDSNLLIDKIESYIKANFTKRISLQEIAQLYGLTQSCLSITYKKYKCINPLEYIINLKIDKAKELLLIQPPISIKDISYAIGYDDPYYFSRIFKTICGKSPSNYREEKVT